MIREMSEDEACLTLERDGTMASQVRRDVRAFLRGGARACELIYDDANPRSLYVAAQRAVKRGGYGVSVACRRGSVFLLRREDER